MPGRADSFISMTFRGYFRVCHSPFAIVCLLAQTGCCPSAAMYRWLDNTVTPLTSSVAQVVTVVVAATLGVVVATSVGGAVAGAVAGAVVSATASSTAGAAGGAAGGSGAAPGGNMMGMVSHVQFMNLCAAGDMGTPPETAAMADGMGWANLQFKIPAFGGSGSNSSGSNNSNGTSATGRRLLQANVSESEPEMAKLTHDEKKLDSKDLFEGQLVYGVLALAFETAVHFAIVFLIVFFTGVPHHGLPAAMKFPGSEIEAFLAMWNPLCLASTIAFARHAVSFVGDNDWLTVLLSVLCLTLAELPWLIWHCWFVNRNVYGEEGVRSINFNETPITKVLATRPTCKLFSLKKVKYQLCLFCEWFDFIICLPFRLSFQGQWKDDVHTPAPGFADVYGPLFMKFSPVMGFGFGYLFGAFLLFQKLAVIVIIGTTIRNTDLVRGRHACSPCACLLCWGLLDVS